VAILSTILPGVRTLRAPLAAGALVLFAIWLAVAPVKPAAKQTGVPGILHTGYDSLSPIAATAVLTAAAYLVGSVVFTMETWAAEFWIRNAWSAALINWLEGQVVDPDALDGTAREKYEALITAKRKSARGFPGELLSPIWAPRGSLRLRQEEWRFVRYRLMSQHPELFAELDRLESEGDLRLAVGPPIAALGIVAAWKTGPLLPAVLIAAASAAIGIASMLTSLRAANQAEELVVDLLRTGMVELPLLEEVRRTRRTESRRNWV
jgi:hypothetical protein